MIADRVIIDASIAVKWFLPKEEGSLAALGWLKTKADFHVPELFFAEFGNVVWQKVKRLDATMVEANLAMKLLKDVPLTTHSQQGLMAPTVELACKYDCSVYDATYVFLASVLNAVFVTADKKLYKKLEHTGFAKHIKLLA